MINNLAVLGSTGSIGRQTLEVVRAFPQRFRIVGLAAGENRTLLNRQVKEFSPRLVYFNGDKTPTKPYGGCEFMTLEEIARHPEVDTVVIATSGNSGLGPTLAAVKSGKRVALANKETLIMAGDIITREAKRHKARILPVDSEHSAIWQCLVGEKRKPAQLILTASGGPFRTVPADDLSSVTPEQALRHPSWHMGPKVTIDSATLMNKGLEVIEAHWLFNIPFDNIRVLVHPESIVHSLVEFKDGSIKAQLGCPDMRLPIQYALSYPERWSNPTLPRLDWDDLKNLTFEPPDTTRFPCLELAISAGRQGGTSPAVLCGADEAAVELFRRGQIKFTDIASLISRVLEEHRPVARPTLDEVLAADAWAREKVTQLTSGDSPCHP